MLISKREWITVVYIISEKVETIKRRYYLFKINIFKNKLQNFSGIGNQYNNWIIKRKLILESVCR